MSDTRLRDQLIRMLDWEEAHVGFAKAVDGIPAGKRGAQPAGLEHSAWQLLEHMRIAQEDILDFCRNASYVHSRRWPDDYWPADPAPPDAGAWDRSVAAFTRDRDALKALTRETPEKQTYLRALLLVMDHNAYHLGQILALRRALGEWT
jgi:uncharacterized damage-inducible protein DinB